MSFTLLYRVFYVIFAMELAGMALLPLLLLLRLLLRDAPRRYMAWAWRLYFLRLLCPVAISSIYSVMPSWNWQYHRVLASLGLTMQESAGFLTGWRAVFQTDIDTTGPYRICVFIWLAGVVLLGVFTGIRQCGIRRAARRDAVRLEGRIYQADLPSPMTTGLFRRRYYLSNRTEAKDLRYVLAHMDARWTRKLSWWRLTGFCIVLLHWFNPLVWYAYILAGRDEEMACDDLAVKRLGHAESVQYAQCLLNMAEETAVIPYTVCAWFERNLRKRAVRMLYYHPASGRQRLEIILGLAALVFISFGLRPFQMAWAGGTWGQERVVDATSAKKTEDTENVVGQCATTSPNGLTLTLRLVMTQGKHTDGMYRGTFILELIGSVGETYRSLSLQDLWEDQGENLEFPEKMTMQTGDYNGDGEQEILLGQQADWTKKQKKMVQEALFADEDTTGKVEYIYRMFSIAERDLTVVSNPIYALGEEKQQAAVPLVDQEIKDLFAVWVPKGRNYYVWDEKQERYSLEKMTQEELNQHKTASQGTAQAGQKETKTLADADGQTVVTVETQSDTTGSMAVESVSVGTGKGQKQMDALEGYYCDLVWATESDGTSDRYAVLIYNGTKAQTFTVYDVQNRQVYYQQEDGNTDLSNVFRQYNGKEITFAEGGAVVYSLMSMTDDVLNISFAANADGGVTVRGSYQYHVKDKRSSDLSFSQSTE